MQITYICQEIEILNRDIPVYAFECAPCEFVIENHFSNTYDAGFTTPEEKTTIKIKVKNVNTFYRNGLLMMHYMVI